MKGENLEEIKEGLRQRIEKYEQNLTALKDERTRIDKEIQGQEELLNSARILYSSETGESWRVASHTFKFAEMSITNAAFEILQEVGKAHVKEIFRKLSEGGKTVGGKRPSITVSSALKQDKRFENIGKNTFRIKKESAPLFQQ